MLDRRADRYSQGDGVGEWESVFTASIQPAVLEEFQHWQVP